MRRLVVCLFLGLLNVAQANDVDTSEIPVKLERVFPNWRVDLPVLVTNAGDQSNRLFVASQKGKVFIAPKDQDAEEAPVFLDLSSKTTYQDREFETGFLGLAFHPKFKENRKFYVYYTVPSSPHTSVISEFQVSKDDPNKADPSSEVEILKIDQPYWNHNGGTVAFGPDGYLYIGLGDGGKANDPHMNGQNVETLLGSILRIDVDKKDGKRKYGIPSDNPFAAQDGRLARPEIYAYGFRNVWRLSFDRANGDLWAADVGQDLWEEINIVKKGGNYGWDLREGRHQFGPAGSDARDNLIEPIFEYDHEVGKSITGGFVYRGKNVPELVGSYVYGDFVTMKLWALKYDRKSKTVVANRSIPSTNVTAMSFGEDEAGELYVSDRFGRIHKFVSAGN